MTTIKAEQVPLLSQTTQLTKLYIFHYDGVTWTFLGLLLEIVKVVSWIGVVKILDSPPCAFLYCFSQPTQDHDFD